MTFSSPPGEGLGAVKSTSWKDILKTRCWSTDCDWWKTISDCSRNQSLKGVAEKGRLAEGLNKVMKGLKVWHWGLCIVYLYPRSEIVKNRYLSIANKDVEVNNKRHTKIRIWAFACEWHQPPDPHFISESYSSLFFCGTAPSGRFVVGLVPTVEAVDDPTWQNSSWCQSHVKYKIVLCCWVQSCLILRDPMDCSPPGSSIHGILQARILEWVAISSSRGYSQTKDWTPALAGGFFPIEAFGKQ